jgi:anaerobic ribonucleoside-triphosphate reductase activating protein
VIKSLQPSYIKGLSVLGGEPFEPENQRGVLELIRRVKSETQGKTVWIYSGFTYEELLSSSRAALPTAREILSAADILVDGRYDKNLRNISLAFRGSENQRIIDLRKTAEKGEVVLAKEYY